MASEFTTSADRAPVYSFEYISDMLMTELDYHLPHGAFASTIRESGGHGDQVKVRRELDLPVSDTALPILAEDRDDTPAKLGKQDMLVTMYEMGKHIKLTKKFKYDSYDDVAASAARALGRHLFRSMDIFGREILAGGTTVFRAADDAGTSAATRSLVAGYPTKKNLAKMLLTARVNRMRPFTKAIMGSAKVGTRPVRPGYPTIVSARLWDILQDSLGTGEDGIQSSAAYPADQMIHPSELGSWREMRFILADQPKVWADSGASATGPGFYSTSNSLADVHAILMLGEGCMGMRKPMTKGDTKGARSNVSLIFQAEGSSGIHDAYKRFSSVGWYMRQGGRIWDDQNLMRGEFVVPA